MNKQQILKNYFYPLNSNVFILKNLPEVIKGTLFSRYSRTTKDIKTLFLEEFYNNEELSGAFGTDYESSSVDVKKAEEFYERVLVGYGDDSVAELGSAHVAVENISMLATKAIEEHRVGLSPLEKSTRYVYYDKKIDGEYQYYRDPDILSSRYAEEYVSVCDELFDTYSFIVKNAQPKLKEIYPGDNEDKAYISSIRAKACDIARSLLPLSTKTNMGVMGNGRAFEYLLTHLINDQLSEVRSLGEDMYSALEDIINPFVKRAVSTRGDSYRDYINQTEAPLLKLRDNYFVKETIHNKPSVNLLNIDSNGLNEIVAATLYQYTDMNFKQCQIESLKMNNAESFALINSLGSNRAVRQHKLHRVTENMYASFEIVADWGVYKDLMRHRVLTRHKKMFSALYGYYVPPEIDLLGFGDKYREVMNKATDLYGKMSKVLPEQAQYLVTHGSYTPFYIKINMRALSHLTELRSVAQGHSSYRFVAQEMARLVTNKFPVLGPNFFKFVDYKNYDLERLDAFKKLDNKAKEKGVDAFKDLI